MEGNALLELLPRSSSEMMALRKERQSIVVIFSKKNPQQIIQ
jgi:hypothetical protein